MWVRIMEQDAVVMSVVMRLYLAKQALPACGGITGPARTVTQIANAMQITGDPAVVICVARDPLSAWSTRD